MSSNKIYCNYCLKNTDSKFLKIKVLNDKNAETIICHNECFCEMCKIIDLIIKKSKCSNIIINKNCKIINLDKNNHKNILDYNDYLNKNNHLIKESLPKLLPLLDSISFDFINQHIELLSYLSTWSFLYKD